MKASEARQECIIAARMSELAKETRIRAFEALELPCPGSIVKHYHHGQIGVIKTQGDQLMLDLHSNAGLRPIGKEELMNWDVIQEPVD